MGEHCSWLLRSLLPSLWEAEVAISAVALLAAAVALLLILDDTASATSPPSSTTKSYDRDGRGRMRGSAKGSKAVAEPGCAGDEVRSIEHAYTARAPPSLDDVHIYIDLHSPPQMVAQLIFPDEPCRSLLWLTALALGAPPRT